MKWKIWIVLQAARALNVNYENWVNTEHVLALFKDALKKSRSSKKTQRPQFLLEQGSFFRAILSIFSSLIIHDFQKLEYSSSFCIILPTDTKNHEKK